MDAMLPNLLLAMDLLGLGLALWLMLHPLSSSAWRGYRSHVQSSMLALCSLAFVFGMAVYDGLWGLTGKADTTTNTMRTLLLPLPLAWVLLAWWLQPEALRARYRWTAGVALALLLLVAGTTLGPALLLTEYLPYSWVFLPAYLGALLICLGLAIVLVLRAHALASGAHEQQARATLLLASPLLLGGAALLAGDVVFGLENPPLLTYTAGLVGQLRLTASASLLLVGVALARIMLLQTRGGGMARTSDFARAFLLIGLTLLLYMAVGLVALWYWRLPSDILAIFLILALMTEGLNHARTSVERLFYRGETGKLRQSLHQSANQLEPVGRIPPVVRPLLGRLARQLHSPQLGLALREGQEYRIAVALHASWEGEVLDVSDPHTWEERSLGGWNKPLKLQGQTVGILASERTGPLSPAQAQLLDDAANQLAQLLYEWQEMAKRREHLHKVIEEYRQYSQSMERKQAALLTRPSARLISRHDVEQLLSQFHAPDTVLGNLPLARLNVVEKVLPNGYKNIEGRAQMLRDLASQLVEQLRPLEGDLPTRPTREWYPYLVLHYFYLEKQTESELLARLKISAGEYTRAHRAGLEAIAATLAELESGIAHSESGRGDTITPIAPTPATGARGTTGSRQGTGYTQGKGSTGYGGGNVYGGGSGSGRSGYVDNPESQQQRTGGWGATGSTHGTSAPSASSQRHPTAIPPQTHGPTQQRNPFSALTDRFRGRNDRVEDPYADPRSTESSRGGVLGTITSFFRREPQQEPPHNEPTASKTTRPISPDLMTPTDGPGFPTSPSTPPTGTPRPGTPTGSSGHSQNPYAPRPDDGGRDHY